MELETTLPAPFTIAPPIDQAALVAEHQRMVFRIAFSVLRNHHEAEEAAQECFLRLFRSAGKLAGVADAKAWIARIAWNAALDCKRRSRAGAEVPLEDLARGVDTLRSQGQSPEQIASGNQMQRLLAQLIAALPTNLQEVVQLSTVEELEHREIALALGITEAAVRSRLFNARQKLKEKLDRLLGERS